MSFDCIKFSPTLESLWVKETPKKREGKADKNRSFFLGERPVRMGRLISITFFIVCLLFALCETAGDLWAAELSRRGQRILIIAHRGGAGLAPENTLAAFRGAFALDVDGVEMDVRLTADGEAVLYHDAQLKPEITRTADGKWLKEKGPAIMDLTLRELKSFDVGRVKPRTKYARRYPKQTASDGERIPTLHEVVTLAHQMGKNTVQFWIEIKTSPLEPDLTPPPEAVADAVIGIVRKADIIGRSLLLSFDWRSLVYAQRVAPEIVTAYISSQSGRFDTIQAGKAGASPWTAGFDIDEFGGSVPRAIHAAGGQYWSPSYRQLDRKKIEEAHSLGLRVIVWTPNKKEEMRRLIDMGVDGITTDRPDLVKGLLGRGNP